MRISEELKDDVISRIGLTPDEIEANSAYQRLVSEGQEEMGEAMATQDKNKVVAVLTDPAWSERVTQVTESYAFLSARRKIATFVERNFTPWQNN